MIPKRPPGEWPPEPPTTKRILEVRCPVCIKVKPMLPLTCILCHGGGFVTPEQRANWERKR